MRSILTLALLSLFVSPCSSYANFYLLSVNQRTTVTAFNGDDFMIDLVQGHSYSCEGFTSDPASTFEWIPENGGGGRLTTESRGDVTPPITSQAGITSLARISFTAPSAGPFFVGVNANPFVGETLTVRCVDTTLYGEYNTFVNPYNFLELTNNTNSTVTGTISANNYDGSIVINAMPFTIPPRR